MLGTFRQAQTPSPLYGEVGYTFLKVKAEGESANLGALRGILGLRPPSEHRMSKACWPSASRTTKRAPLKSGVTVNSKLELQNSYGVYVEAQVQPQQRA
jgi:hypothetical protein